MRDEPARLYFGKVVHRRLFPVRYRFVYRVFSVLLDIDRVAEAARTTWLFSYNRFNVFGFYESDHGPRDGSGLRPWIDGVLARAKIDLEGGSVRLLCFPRVLGYVFSPLSLWYCQHRDGRLKAVLCEVRNTFGESHGYLLHADGADLDWPVRQTCGKSFHVSPFISMEAEYHFRLARPGDALSVAIREYQCGQPMLVAVQSGHGRPFDTPGLVWALLTTPLMTFKVIGMIHWQALKIWLRGAAFHKKPLPPLEQVTL
jgi:DUF1365 family protein